MTDDVQMSSSSAAADDHVESSVAVACPGVLSCRGSRHHVLLMNLCEAYGLYLRLAVA